MHGLICLESQDVKIICAWCQKVIKDADTEFNISHGICEDCSGLVDFETVDLDKFIEQFDVPVMVVDENRIIRKANIPIENKVCYQYLKTLDG